MKRRLKVMKCNIRKEEMREKKVIRCCICGEEIIVRDGNNPYPVREWSAMGTDKTVPCIHFETSLEAVEYFRSAGYTVLAAEPGGVEAWEVEESYPLAVVFGNEALGVAAETLEKVDGIISLPMNGGKASINVGNAAAAILYAIDARRRGKIGTGK